MIDTVLKLLYKKIFKICYLILSAVKRLKSLYDGMIVMAGVSNLS